MEVHIRDEIPAGVPLLLSLQDLEELLTRVSQNAIAAYERLRDPLSDRLKQSEVRRYLSHRGVPPSELRVWVEKGLLRGEKSGGARNAAVWYSKADIERLFAMYELERVEVQDFRWKKKLGIEAFG